MAVVNCKLVVCNEISENIFIHTTTHKVIHVFKVDITCDRFGDYIEG